MSHIKNLVIVSDAWHPQINGVVRTLTNTIDELHKRGIETTVIHPGIFRTIPTPSYPEIRLAILPYRKLTGLLDETKPDAIHIATEGPLGWAARRYCLRRKLPFTTAYHTQFPEYIRARIPISLDISYPVMRKFHLPATRTLVSAYSMYWRLHEWGFKHLTRWGRGVDDKLFKPYNEPLLQGKRPIAVYLGRVAIEKNIESFLQLELAGSKYVVGDGPDLPKLKARYPEVHFTGYKTGEPLAKHLADADVMVFPSLTDTYGVSMLEAMACGVPVAAFPVTGPIDIIQNGINGWTNEDLSVAVEKALKVSPESCREFASEHSWKKCTDEFLSALAPISLRTTNDTEIEKTTISAEA